MTFCFMRMQPDGRLSAIAPARQFKTKADAKRQAGDFLIGKRGGGKLVLVQVLEEAILTATVRYEEFTGSP